MFKLVNFFLLTSVAGLIALAGLLWFAHNYAVQQLVSYAEIQKRHPGTLLCQYHLAEI